MTDWHAGDTDPDLTGSTGTDLTPATSVTIHVRTPAGSLISRDAVVATGRTGAWSLPWQVGELTEGVYESEAEVTWADGGIETYSGPSFRVLPQLDGVNPAFIPPLAIVDNGDGTSTITWS